MWILRIYDRSSDCRLDIKTFSDLREVSKFLVSQGIFLLDCSMCLDFEEV